VVLPPAKEGKTHREFGFVHFAERAAAVRAVEAVEKGDKKYELEGNALVVGARMPAFDASFQTMHAGTHRSATQR
jgi:hypothetical protein